MDYRVLALKYRPGAFAEVVGQEQVTGVLAGAIRQGRIANAYLFAGPRGCGKTTTARILAKSLNCEQGPTPEPCGECESCLAIAGGSSLGVIEIDAASTGGVEDIRGIREEASLASMGGRYKVYILDEAHQISPAGANALLKTLEEPPPNTVFVLATTEPLKIIPTIHSRCQRFQFGLLSVEQIAGRLAHICERESVEAPPETLAAIARRADGSMRDGLTLLDQVLASVDGPLVLDRVTEILGLTPNDRFFGLCEAFAARDGAAALRELDRILAGGVPVREFALGLAGFFRNLLLLKLDPELVATEMGESEREACLAFAAGWKAEDLLYLTRLAGERADHIRYAGQPRVLLETLVVEIARLESRVLLSEILGRLKALAGEGEGGGAPAPAGGGAARAGRSGAGRGGRSAAPAAGKGAMAGPETVAEAPPAAPRTPASPRAAAPAAAPATKTESGAAPAADGAWGDFVRQVSRSKKSLGSFLEHARPGGIGPKHFTLVVQNPFHLAMLDTPEHLRLLGETFASAYGERRQIRLELVAGDAADAGGAEKTERISSERAQAARRKQQLADHAGDDLIQDLLQRFDGEIVED